MNFDNNSYLSYLWVGDDVFISMFANYVIYIHRSRSTVCQICFHNCQFLKNESEVDLKKMHFASKLEHTNIQYDPANY